jgi:crotonobetainyl-CoA:carnitine CoA-transferase CaiB-like acyl-CoA transferase
MPAALTTAPGGLAGLRVVDLTTILMGPFATRILADHGADVVRLETLSGDTARNSQPARHQGMSGLALNLQRNKRSLALDLKAPEGRKAARAVVGGADVVVTNMRRAALERLGLDPAAVRAEHPRLIYCVANGFGSSGPYADRPAYDDAIQAGSGLAWLQGRVATDGEPRYLPTIVVDKVCGMAVAQAVLVALVHQARCGEGQTVEVPMLETMVAFNLLDHQRGHTFEPPIGEFGYDRLLTPYRRPYRTADGWAGLLPYNDRHWREFFAIAGKPELADDPRFADHNARIAHIDELYRLVEELAPTLTTADWLERCEAAQIPAMAVLDLSRFQDDPHLAAVGLVEVVEHPTEGTYRHVREPAALDRTPAALRRHAPRLGEHTREVLAEAGYGPAEIDALVAAGVAGVAGTPPEESSGELPRPGEGNAP